MPTNKKPTAAQFYKKFGPDIETMSNCLRNIACPKCGAREGFHITATATFEDVSDDGTDQYNSVDWTDSNHVGCAGCDHVGTIFDFTIDGLDELLEAKEQKTETT